jgi:amino acid adenylation domain-containing protein
MVVDAPGRQTSEGPGAPTPLPAAARPSGKSEITRSESIRLSPDATARLRSFAANNTLEVRSIVSAAWAIVLNRYSGEDYVTFGIATSSLAIVPVRLQASGDQSLLPWLTRVAETLREQKAFAESPPSDGATPFETAIIFRAPEVARYLPLVLYADPSPESALQIVARFDPSCFLEGALPHILGQLKTILEHMAIAETGELVSAVPLLTEAERRHLVVNWNDTRTDFRGDACIDGWFEQQVERTPDRAAVIFRGQQLSYRELNERADRLARRLRELGAGPDVIVGISVERSLEMMVGLLGILKAGAAYMPLDPAFPLERTQFMLEDSRSPILVTQEHLAAQFPGTRAQVVFARSVWDGPPVPPPPPSGVESRHLAYVIYTSGSTGKPKGVMIEHRQVSNFFAAMDQVIGTEPGVWLAVTSISFDISILELFWTLARGFTVVVQRESEKLIAGGGYSFAAQIRNHRVTHMQCTPSMARFLVSNPESFQSLRGLRKLMLGGEALPPALAAQLRGAVSGDVFNLYGPTETTVWSAAHRIALEEATIPIGRPIANTRIYILDAQLQPVPPGAPGELFIAGEGVTRGYLNRSELTAEKFIPDTIHGGPVDRMYRTGDLARYRFTGDIEFLGRIDNQVKILGFRIEPEEIEAVLGRHAGVEAIAVVAREDLPGEKKLVAYVVPRDGQLALPDLRTYAHDKLPAHMVPAAFVKVDALLYTPNRKVDKKALAALGVPRADATPPQITTAGLEAMIAGAFKEALGVDEVGVQDNFFDLGANSLVVAEVAVTLRNSLGRDIPLTDLFQYPTIRTLTAYLTQGPAENAPSERGSRRGQARKEALRLRSRAGTTPGGEGQGP